jgi:hypothetical protein
MAEETSDKPPVGYVEPPRPLTGSNPCQTCSCTDFIEAAGSSFCQRTTCRHGIWVHT